MKLGMMVVGLLKWIGIAQWIAIMTITVLLGGADVLPCRVVTVRVVAVLPHHHAVVFGPIW
jgi:hypothetical protein